MKTIDAIRSSDQTARAAILSVVHLHPSVSPTVVIRLVTDQHPRLSVNSIRRATWSLVSEQTLSLTPDYKLQGP